MTSMESALAGPKSECVETSEMLSRSVRLGGDPDTELWVGESETDKLRTGEELRSAKESGRDAISDSSPF